MALAHSVQFRYDLNHLPRLRRVHISDVLESSRVRVCYDSIWKCPQISAVEFTNNQKLDASITTLVLYIASSYFESVTPDNLITDMESVITRKYSRDKTILRNFREWFNEYFISGIMKTITGRHLAKCSSRL